MLQLIDSSLIFAAYKEACINMSANNHFEVIIIGGSYSGLSAAMALGRSLRRVLIIDSGKPCNRQTPHSHNFLTQDSETPAAIARKAKEQVLAYDTIVFHNGLAVQGTKTAEGFAIRTEAGDMFTAHKLLVTTGIKDSMPDISGFAECWGISVLHCPYCHGYEVKQTHLGLVGNGDIGFEFCRMLLQWSKQLTLFTNGRSTLTEAQTQHLASHGIAIIEKEITVIDHINGQLRKVVLRDGSAIELTALFAKIAFTQHSDIPASLGCAVTEQGFIQVDEFQKTTIPGLYSAGDNTTMFRSVALAVAGGMKAGAMINKELIEETF